MTGPSPDEIIWLAWRIGEDGSVQTVVTLEGEEKDEHPRERRDFDSLEAAEEALGPGFREVAEKVLETGRRAGRWRP